MQNLKRLVQLCLIWCVTNTIKTQGETLSKENIFQLQKHPAANRYDEDGEVIKNISKICYDNNDTRDDDGTVMATATHGRDNNNNNNNTANILNIFANILQQIQSRECEQIEQEKVNGSDFQSIALKHKEKERKSQYESQPFNILEQLRLDEHREKLQQEEQQQQWELQQQENALKRQQFLQHINGGESLGKAGKKKIKRRKKKKRKKKKRKEKPIKNTNKKQKPSPLLAQPAHILFATATQKPPHDAHHPTATAMKPQLQQHPLLPIKKIKYILRKNTIFKKKKKEYLHHLKHVLYPFVKFVAFFTVINPFTLAVFLFSLVSPVLFGFLGFIGLSFFIKPALNLLFGLKHTVNAIKRRKLQQLRKRQRLRDRRRPITIHKHYYQQTPIAPPLKRAPPRPPAPAHPPHHHYPVPPLLAVKPKAALPHAVHREHPLQQQEQQIKLFNPLLPDVRQKLKKQKHFRPDIQGHNDSFEEF